MRAWLVTSVAVMLLAIVLLIVGGLLALNGYVYVIGILGLVGAVALIAFPTVALWLTIVFSLAVVGLVELYLPAFKIVRWVVPVLGGAALLAVVLRAANRDRREEALGANARAVLLAALAFGIVALASTLIGRTSLSTSAAGLKGYFQVLSLLFAFAFFPFERDQLLRFPKFLVVLALLQLPFVLHQFFVLVPLRSGAGAAALGIVAVDIVAGTFGGIMSGGGRSPALAFLAAICATLVWGQWKQGTRTLRSALVMSIALILPLFLNETKLIIVYVPLAMLFVFREMLVKRPLRFLVAMGVMFSLVASVLVGYTLLPGAASQRKASVSVLYEDAVAYNLGSKGYGNAVLNRRTVYSHWWREHAFRSDYVHALIGHGPGQSSSLSLIASNTLASQKYPKYFIGITGLSTLLWEVGLLGVGVALLLLWRAYGMCRSVAESVAGTAHEPMARAAQVSVVLVAVSLLHNNYFATDMIFQTLMFLMIGYSMAMTRFLGDPVRVGAAARFDKCDLARGHVPA
jgi:hypothetical protein